LVLKVGESRIAPEGKFLKVGTLLHDFFYLEEVGLG